MNQQFLNHVRKTKLVEPSDRIMLAVSGGLDSMVMLKLFHNAGFTIAVAHCNFQLRGSESDSDEVFIRQVCDLLKVPFYSKRFLTADYAAQKGLSIQQAARELRYDWFKELGEQEQYNLLATAHHVNDSLETLVLNLTRGTGLRGMCGIPERNGNIIRPLLVFSRNELQQYAKEQGIGWREDSSNDSDDYQRNFIRHHVVPLLAELNPKLEAGFLKTINRLKSSLAMADVELQRIKDQFVVYQYNRITIRKSFALHVSYPSQVLWELIKIYGFNGDQCDDIITAIGGNPGKRFLSVSHELVIDRETLILTTLREAWMDVVIEATQQEATLGEWTMGISEAAAATFGTDASIAFVDRDKVQFPLTWRLWKEGDFFYPLGMQQKKKISDFLIDRKVSLPDKSSVTVLESGGEIIWVVGYRLDDRFKVTPDTNHILRLLVIPFFV